MSALGDYDLEAEIGRGAMGRVYRARHRRTGVIRALKTLDHPGDVEAVLRFRREAEALARVGGAVAVAIHESGSDGQRFYFVMDLMPGGSLAQRLAKGTRLAWSEAVAIVATLARHLAALHHHGLVHRDLKPANVLFGDDGEPRLADLGCVRDVASSSLTASGTLLGTLDYMAPEQLRGERAGPPADVFALGAILHEAVSGARLHEGGVAEHLRRGQDARSRARVATLVPGVPPGLDLLIDRALAHDPARRPDPASLARDLERLLTGDAAKRQSARGRRGLATPARAAGLGLGLAALVGLPLAVAWRRASPSAAPAVGAPAPTPSSGRSPSSGSGSPATDAAALARVHDVLQPSPGAKPAPITSVTLPLADLAAVVRAGKGDVVLDLAARGLIYDSFELERALPSDPPVSARSGVATLWAYSALASGRPDLRAPAVARLSELVGTRPLIEAIGCIDSAALLLAPGDHEVATLPPTLAVIERLAVPPAVLAGVCAPLERVCRREALEATCRRFADVIGASDSHADSIVDLLNPLDPPDLFDKLPPKIRFEVFAMRPALVRKQIERALLKEASRSGSRPPSITTDALDVPSRQALAPGYRRLGSEFETVATELAASDPTIAAEARFFSFEQIVIAQVAEGRFDDGLDEEARRALGEIAALPSDDRAPPQLDAALRHDLDATLGFELLSRGAGVLDPAERASLAARAVAATRAALDLVPPPPTGAEPGETLGLDRQRACFALLLSGAAADDPRIRELERGLRRVDWLRAELPRRRGELDRAAAYIGELDAVERRDRPFYWLSERRIAIAVRALSRIESGDREGAWLDLTASSNLTPWLVLLPELRPEAIRERYTARFGPR